LIKNESYYELDLSWNKTKFSITLDYDTTLPIDIRKLPIDITKCYKQALESELVKNKIQEYNKIYNPVNMYIYDMTFRINSKSSCNIL
jgi:hypothetical protein